MSKITRFIGVAAACSAVGITPIALAAGLSSVRASSTGISILAEGDENDETEWIEINLESAGTLGVETLYKVNVLSDVVNIRITGPLNADDWTTIKNMTSLQKIDLSGTTATSIPAEQFSGRSSLQTCLLPPTMKSIGYRAFYQSGIREMTLPASVTSVGESCFYSCKSLLSFESKGLTSIPGSCFYYCESLVSAVLNEGVTEIKSSAFSRCSALSNVTLPSTLVSIEDHAFGYTSALSELVFPEGLTSIGSDSFYYSGITKAILPSTLATLSSSAFDHCSALTEVAIPPRIRTIGSSTFYSCTSLSKVTCSAATPPVINSNAFSNVPVSAATLSVPDFAVVNYKLDTEWLKFGTIEGGAESNYWSIHSDLSLTNNRRMDGTPVIDLFETGRLTVGGNAPMPVESLDIYSSVSRSPHTFGQLINNSPEMTANSAALHFYVPSNSWVYISTPCDVALSAISHQYGKDFIFRYYDGESRGANGAGASWKNVAADGVLEAGKGYILQTNGEGYVNFNLDSDCISGLLAAGNRLTPVTAWESESEANAGWNLIGNPYACYYDLDASSLSSPVTIWNGNGYTAYNLVDDDVVLEPMQAFFIQQTGSDAEITFGAEGRQFTSEVSRPAAQARIKAADTVRRLLNLEIAGADGSVADRTRVVINPDASDAYEASCDAAKFFYEDSAMPAIYTVDAEGNRLAINERPLADSVVRMGLYSPAAGKWIISAGASQLTAELTDHRTGLTMTLDGTRNYKFSTTGEGYDDDRFTLRIGGVSTGVGSIEPASAMLDVKTYGGIMTVSGAGGVTVEVFAADGTLAAAATACEEAEFQLPAGLYIVRAGRRSVKVIM